VGVSTLNFRRDFKGFQTPADADLHILWWHSLHTAMEESPRTAITPGLGKGVEHSEHVGVKALGQ